MDSSLSSMNGLMTLIKSLATKQKAGAIPPMHMWCGEQIHLKCLQSFMLSGNFFFLRFRKFASREKPECKHTYTHFSSQVLTLLLCSRQIWPIYVSYVYVSMSDLCFFYNSIWTQQNHYKCIIIHIISPNVVFGLRIYFNYLEHGKFWMFMVCRLQLPEGTRYSKRKHIMQMW